MFCTYNLCGLPEEDPMMAETCWSCNTLIGNYIQ